MFPDIAEVVAKQVRSRFVFSVLGTMLLLATSFAGVGGAICIELEFWNLSISCKSTEFKSVLELNLHQIINCLAAMFDQPAARILLNCVCLLEMRKLNDWLHSTYPYTCLEPSLRVNPTFLSSMLGSFLICTCSGLIPSSQQLRFWKLSSCIPNSASIKSFALRPWILT